jgi:homoserine dehydrogenase
VIQEEHGSLNEPVQTVSLVIMTYDASEGASRRAVEEIERLESIDGPCVRMRVAESLHKELAR